MFWNKKAAEPVLLIACSLCDHGYSIAGVRSNTQVLFSQSRLFNEDSRHLMMTTLAEDVDRFNLIAHKCRLILIPGQYQLLLIDAPNVPAADMTKALRWSLKGLSDYDLDDVAIDAFLLPILKADDQKKALVAITPLSVLNNKRALLESVFLDVTTISIAEMALKNLLPLMQIEKEAPFIIISLCGSIRKLHIVYNDTFYLIRELTQDLHPNADEPVEMAGILLEIERSIDYCINKLKLPEPKQLFFTPGFYNATSFFQTLEQKLGLTVSMIDLNQYLKIEPALSLEEQHLVFYSITGAIDFNHDEEIP